MDLKVHLEYSSYLNIVEYKFIFLKGVIYVKKCSYLNIVEYKFIQQNV